MSYPWCPSISKQHLIDDLNISLSLTLDLGSYSCLRDNYSYTQSLTLDSNILLPKKAYATGLMGDMTRLLDEQEWVKNLGSERLTAASLSFVKGAMKCLPALSEGKAQKVLECGLDRASHTLRQKPPPVRFEVAPYFTGGAYFSFIVDWY